VFFSIRFPTSISRSVSIISGLYLVVSKEYIKPYGFIYSLVVSKGAHSPSTAGFAIAQPAAEYIRYGPHGIRYGSTKRQIKILLFFPITVKPIDKFSKYFTQSKINHPSTYAQNKNNRSICHFWKKKCCPKTPEIRKTENRQVQALITPSDPTGSGSNLVVGKGSHRPSSASFASLSWRLCTSGMARQTYEKTAKRDHRNVFSQFSVAHRTGSSSFQPNLSHNSSSIVWALPKTENRKWIRLSRRQGWRHKLDTFRQKSKIPILWRHYLGQF